MRKFYASQMSPRNMLMEAPHLSAGQGALAFVTAATHGLEDEMARIEEALQPELAAELKAGLQSDAQLLIPPVPILKEDNWPLLTVSKGFFESLAAGGASPSALRDMCLETQISAYLSA